MKQCKTPIRPVYTYTVKTKQLILDYSHNNTTLNIPKHFFYIVFYLPNISEWKKNPFIVR